MDLVAHGLSELLDEEERERLHRIQRAFLHYEGEVERESVPAGEVDDSIRPMRAGSIVDKGASFLFGGPGGVQLQTDDEKAVGKLGEVWPEDERSVQLRDLSVNGGVTGHAFVRLRLDGRLIVLDPANVYPEWDEDDYEQVHRWKVQWIAEDRKANTVQARRQTFEPTESGATWEIATEHWQGNRWVMQGDVVPWPFAWAPILHAKNLPAPNRFWGTADLESHILDLIEAQWSLLAYMRRLVRYAGHPSRWAAGEDMEDTDPVDVSADQLVKFTGRDVKVGQFPAAGDLGASLELYRTVREELRELTRMPEVSHGKADNVGSLSGFALSILYGPLTEQTTTKHGLYGPLVSEIAARKLELSNFGEGIEVKPVWHEMVPRDPDTETKGLEADQRMGLASRQTLRERRGYDHETEQVRLAEEREATPEEVARLFDAGRIET